MRPVRLYFAQASPYIGHDWLEQIGASRCAGDRISVARAPSCRATRSARLNRRVHVKSEPACAKSPAHNAEIDTTSDLPSASRYARCTIAAVAIRGVIARDSLPDSSATSLTLRAIGPT